MDLHLLFAWTWILIGLLTGTLLGLFFAGDDRLGGYGSWPRRLVRLGHIAFVGTGLLNLGAHWTLREVAAEPATATAVRALFVAGAVLMPLLCFAAAFHRQLRHAFALPIAALCGGSGVLVHLVATTR